MNKIIAVVKFNQGEAWVMRDPITLLYERKGDTLVGTDGVFVDALYHRIERGGSKAFGGRAISFPMHDGSILESDGWWWSGSARRTFDVVSVTAKDIEGLKQCYVYCGYEAIKLEAKKLREAYKGPVYEYYDYEALITKNPYQRGEQKEKG